MTWFISEAFAQETPAAPAATAAAPASEPAAAPAAASSQPAPAAEGTTAHVAAGGEEHHGFPPFEPSTFPSQILWLVLAFVALYKLVAKKAVPQIGGILEARAARIKADVAAAEAARADTDAAIKAYEQALADARSKASAIAFENRTAVHKDIDAKRHAAEAELATKLAAAEARVAEVKAKAMADVSAIASETTEAIVSTLIGSVSADEAAAAVAAVRKS